LGKLANVDLAGFMVLIGFGGMIAICVKPNKTVNEAKEEGNTALIQPNGEKILFKLHSRRPEADSRVSIETSNSREASSSSERHGITVEKR
ncbi:10763_t:CDS:1, partial [Acaulospora colombiana]